MSSFFNEHVEKWDSLLLVVTQRRTAKTNVMKRSLSRKRKKMKTTIYQKNVQRTFV